MSIELPELPYARNALEPLISENTLNFHYGKHHNAYVVNLNKLIEGSEFASSSLEDIIKATSGDSSKAGIFNNAAQIWNHTFYWNSIAPNAGGQPTGAIADKINASFGSYDKFKSEFATAAATQFGSGWAWLVQDGDALKIVKTPNAETPLTQDVTPLLTIDVWEHAYYLDYQNLRPKYIETFIDQLINWDFANANLK
jgi:Fe-Mn family superoxide dismutase